MNGIRERDNEWRRGGSDESVYPICSKFAICSFGTWVKYIPLGHVTCIVVFTAPHLPAVVGGDTRFWGLHGLVE